MDIKRRIVIQAILTKEGELIPIWDDRISFEKTEMYGNRIILKGGRNEYYSLVECIYDLKDRKLEVGIELNYYPEKTEFEKGESVFFEKSNRILEEAKVSDIVYETYDMQITKGGKLSNWTLNYFKDVEIDKNSLYAIKMWKPFYVLDNGIKIEWAHQLYHKYSK